jgi:hypothetical protein
METSRAALIASMTDAIRIAGTTIFEHLAIICRTATKNIDLGLVLANSLDKIAGRWFKKANELATNQPDTFYNVFHMIANIRDCARQVFQGSIAAAVLDDNHFVKLMLEYVKDITSQMGLQTAASEMITGVEASTKAQTTDNVRDAVAALTEKEVTAENFGDVLKVFNTKIEVLREEAAMLKRMGITKAYFANKNTYAATLKVDKEALDKIGTRLNLQIIKDTFADMPSQANWLAFFRNRISLTLDDYCYGIACLS